MKIIIFQEVFVKKNIFVLFVLSPFVMSMYSLGPKTVTLTKLWEVEIPLAETAQYDEKNDILYVTGMGETPFTGTTWKLNLQGEIITKDWVTGLNQVRGSKLSGSNLFIAELQGLAKIDLKSGNLIKRYDVPDAGMFNNIAMDTSGNLYITDTPKNGIYMYDKKKDTFEKWLESPKLEWPNGIFFDKGQLIAAPWGTVTDPATWGTEVPGRLQTISLKTKEINFLGGNETPLCNGDGLVGDGKGNYFVGDWMTGKIYLANKKAEATLIETLSQGMGDFTYVPKKSILIVPVGKLNKVFAFQVNN
jgi:sugar lactone lactonase YvrE